MDVSNSDFLSMLSISREKANRNLEEARNYIILDLRNIAAILSSYHPLEIARMSVWEERRVRSQDSASFSRISSRLMPVLIQSVILSDLCVPSSNNRAVKSRDWQRIISLSEDVSRRLARYIDNLAIIKVNEGKVTREDVVDYREELYGQFFPETKTHEILLKEKAIAASSLEWDRPEVEKAFGTTPERLVQELYKISDSALDLIDRINADASAFKERVEEALKKEKDEDPMLSDDEAIRRVYLDKEISRENSRLTGLRDDFDMFRPEFYSDLGSAAIEKLSSEPGQIDMISLLFDEGIWSATCYPFIKLSGMYFSFVSPYLLAIYQRFSATSMHLGALISASADNALSALFGATDVVGVYTYEGKKIDVEVLSSLGEINLVSESELWQQRKKRRSREMTSRPQMGHKMLILNPDGNEELEKSDEDTFLTSLSYLLRLLDDSSLRKEFYQSLFDSAEEREESMYSDDLFDDETSSNIQEDDSLDSDELLLNDFDDDDVEEAEGDEEEKEYESYSDPSEAMMRRLSADERKKNEEIYEINHERILLELELDVDNNEYSVVDEDELDPEEADEEDEYDDPSQLDFLDLLDAYASEEESQEPDGEDVEEEELYSEAIDEMDAEEQEEKEFVKRERKVPEDNAPLSHLDEDENADESRHAGIISEISARITGEAGAFFSFLEKEDESVIDQFEKTIHQCWDKMQTDRKDKMFSVFEYDMSLILLKERSYDELKKADLMNSAGSVMYSRAKSEWNVLFLYINGNYEVEDARMIRITPSSFNPSDWKIVVNKAMS